jgi:hypothetical protein
MLTHWGHDPSGRPPVAALVAALLCPAPSPITSIQSLSDHILARAATSEYFIRTNERLAQSIVTRSIRRSSRTDSSTRGGSETSIVQSANRAIVLGQQREPRAGLRRDRRHHPRTGRAPVSLFLQPILFQNLEAVGFRRILFTPEACVWRTKNVETDWRRNNDQRGRVRHSFLQPSETISFSRQQLFKQYRLYLN